MLGISYWTKNYRTALETADPVALGREYPYYDPIHLLPAEGQARWRSPARATALELVRSPGQYSWRAPRSAGTARQAMTKTASKIAG